jgi:hypothetical protein
MKAPLSVPLGVSVVSLFAAALSEAPAGFGNKIQVSCFNEVL